MAYDSDWRDDAHCRDEDPNRMQPEQATPTELEDAMAVCAACPVWAQCQTLAEEQGLGAYGIHAGHWYGDPPANPDTVPCQWCEQDMDRGERGTRAYCSSACRKRAQRARDEREALEAIPA